MAIGPFLRFATGYLLSSTNRVALMMKGGGVATQKLRGIILSDIGVVRESLTSIRQKEFRAAKLKMELAEALKRSGNSKRALYEYKAARRHAEVAIGACKSLDEKLEATKMAAICAIHECDEDEASAKVYCSKYMGMALAMPDLMSDMDVKYSNNNSSISFLKSAIGKRRRNEIVDLYFSIAWSICRYMSNRAYIQWHIIKTPLGVNIHPLTVTSDINRVTNGNRCTCDKVDNNSQLATGLRESKCEVIYDCDPGKEGKQVNEMLPIAGDRGYYVRITMSLHNITAITITNPHSEHSDMNIDPMICHRMEQIKTAIRGNLLVLFTTYKLVLYDITSGMMLWSVPGEDMNGGELDWSCDKHIKVVKGDTTMLTISLWN